MQRARQRALLALVVLAVGLWLATATRPVVTPTVVSGTAVDPVLPAVLPSEQDVSRRPLD